MKPGIVVRSGVAGALFKQKTKKEKYEEFAQDNADAAQLGLDILNKGGSAIDAVEKAIMFLEDKPFCNAGTGSHPNMEGRNEMEAIIMDGSTLACGGVGCIRDVKNPVAVARKVMDLSGHVLLVGSGATQFARQNGFEEYDPMVDEVREEWHKLNKDLGGVQYPWQKFDKILKEHPEIVHGAAGAVAIDSDGDIAAGSSAGGTFFRLPGRVGDTPLVGCGTYADSSAGGVSITGLGEVIIKLTMAKRAVEFMDSGFSAKTALAASLDVVKDYEKKYFYRKAPAGFIGIDVEGEIGVAFDNPYMLWAYVKEGMDSPVTSQPDRHSGIVGN